MHESMQHRSNVVDKVCNSTLIIGDFLLILICMTMEFEVFFFFHETNCVGTCQRLKLSPHAFPTHPSRGPILVVYGQSVSMLTELFVSFTWEDCLLIAAPVL